MAGRKPIPDALKVIRSPTPRKDRMNPDKPEYSDLLQVPQHFDKERKDAWFEIVPQLIEVGVAQTVDVQALEMLVEKWVEWRGAQDKLNSTGLVTKAPSGYPMMNPYYTITIQLGKEIRSLLSEFGMTPASRQKIRAEKDSGGSEFDNI